MNPMVFGIETEYGWFSDNCLLEFIEKTKDVVTVRFHNWLGNGGKLYEDCGHPEYATPECSNPTDLVIYAEAADKTLKEMSLLHKSNISKTNIGLDRCDQVVSWGAHESYMYRNSEFEMRRRQLATHLATRIIFCGIGGTQLGNDRHQFAISPRAFFINEEEGSDSTCSRPLVDTREESLSCDFGRQHVLSGEPNCSQLSLYLKVGTTALVVAMIDNDVDLSAVKHSDPITLFREVSTDIDMKDKYHFGRNKLTANEVQNFFLRKARENLDVLPEWAGEVCDVWEDTLIRLRGGWLAVCDRIDWAIKYAVFRNFLENKGLDPSGLTERMPYNRSIIDNIMELNWKYGQLSDGIFEGLDKAGVLNHKMPGVTEEAINHAMDHAPNTRAKARGDMIKNYNGTILDIDWGKILTTEDKIHFDNPLNLDGERTSARHDEIAEALEGLNAIDPDGESHYLCCSNESMTIINLDDHDDTVPVSEVIENWKIVEWTGEEREYC